jgi:uncharacterized protein with HEPN domain
MSPSKSPQLRLRHVLEEIDGIGRAIEGKTKTECIEDYLLSRAMGRALEIVSEAVRALPEDWLVRFPEIRWGRIKGMGNFLRHEYHLLDRDVVWDAVTVKLPELRKAVSAMLEESEL